MAKTYNIRWSDKDNEALRKKVKNFNAKISRLQKTADPETVAALPEKLSVRQLKKDLTTRKDFQRLIKNTERFTKRGAEELVNSGTGFKITKYEKQKYINEVRIQNIKNTFKAKKLGISVEAGNLGQLRELNLQPREPIMGKTIEEFRARDAALEKMISDGLEKKLLAQYRENYLKGIESNFGGKMKKDLEKRIKNISDEDLFNATAANPKLIIDFMYDTNFTQEEIFESLTEAWDESIQGV